MLWRSEPDPIRRRAVLSQACVLGIQARWVLVSLGSLVAWDGNGIPFPSAPSCPSPSEQTPEGPWPVQGSCEEKTWEFGAFGGKGSLRNDVRLLASHSWGGDPRGSSTCHWLPLPALSQGSARALLSPSCQRHLSLFLQNFWPPADTNVCPQVLSDPLGPSH